MQGEGLDVPETTRIIHELNREGFNLPLDALDIESCAAAIAKTLE